jgi:hypothetical protein
MHYKRNLVSMFRLAHKSKVKARRIFSRGAISGFPILLLLLAGSPAHAQLNSNIAGVNLAATLATSLRVTASPGLVNFALVRNGAVTGSSVITVNTSWTLNPGFARVRVYAYFTSAAAALTDGAGDNIPSSSVSGSANGGAFRPFTGGSPYAAGSSIRLSTTRIRGNNTTGTHVDTLNMMISTVGLNLPAGNYTGVLNIQARAL